jgi:hypothetical protein
MGSFNEFNAHASIKSLMWTNVLGLLQVVPAAIRFCEPPLYRQEHSFFPLVV